MSPDVIMPEQFKIVARRDLRIVRRSERGESFFLVEDPLRGKFFRLGEAEHAFFALLDGRRSLAEAAASATTSESTRFESDDAARLAEWLLAAGLASPVGGSTLCRSVPHDSSAAASLAKWNPWSFRVALGSPDRWLRPLDPSARLLFSGRFFIVWLVAVGWSLQYVASHWSKLIDGAPIVWGARGAIVFGLAWCGLKLWHELGHAMACRRFGGNVGQAGLAFILGMPSPFVDVSSIRRSPSKWQRICVSLAGVYCELTAASIALLIHAASHDPAVRQAAIAVAMVAGLGPLVLNLNPLMRFDGYFALSDFVEVPNLAAAGKEEARRLYRRYVQGFDESIAPEPPARPRWIAWYGTAAAGWRILMSASLGMLAIVKFGLPFAALASLPLFGAWLARGGSRRRVASSNDSTSPRNLRRRAATICVAAASMVALVGWFDPRVRELHAVVDYEPLTVVRAETSGFVRRVYVGAGEQVAAGAIIAELDNEELRGELTRAEIAVEQSRIRSRMHRQAGAPAKEQTEQSQRKVLEAELAELQERQSKLKIIAPIGGTIVEHRPERLIGLWLEQGTEVVAIGDEAAKAVHIAVPQRLVAAVDRLEEREAAVVVAGGKRPFTIQLTGCEPTASTRLMHPALSTEHGGSTLVRRRKTNSADDVPDGPTDRSVTIAETLEPCFTMKAAADAAVLRDVAAGRTGVIRIRLPWRAVWSDASMRAAAWLHDPHDE